MSWSLVLLPLVGAAIGWFTNYLAVKMLFRPRRPVTLLGIRIQGLIPHRRDELARTIAEVVEQELLAGDDVAQALQSEAFRSRLTDLLDERLAEQLRQALASRPLAREFLTEEVLAPIRRGLIREVMNAFPSAAGLLREALAEHLDVGEIVSEKVRQLDLDRLEALVFRVARQEFRYIELVGGLIGLVVGLVQMLLVAVLR